MAKQTFETVAPDLLRDEGGYVDHPRDPGGATNYGVTIGTLSAWLGRRATKQDVRDLAIETAMEIYKAQYWDTVRGDDLPAGVDYAVYDYAVNSGPARAARELQRVVGASPDGVVGAMTLQAVRTCGKTPGEIIDALCDRRLAFMKTLKTWSTFGKGWSARVARVRNRALQLAAAAPLKHMPPKPKPDETATAKARQEDTSGLAAWKTPEGLATGIGALSGLTGMMAGSGPVQWAMAAVVIGAAIVGLVHVTRQLRAPA